MRAGGERGVGPNFTGMLGSSPFAILHGRSFGPNGPAKPPRVDLRRVARYFAPYAAQEALVLFCGYVNSVEGAVIGLELPNQRHQRLEVLRAWR